MYIYISQLIALPQTLRHALLNHARQRPRHLEPRLAHLDYVFLWLLLLVRATVVSASYQGPSREAQAAAFTGGRRSWPSSR